MSSPFVFVVGARRSGTTLLRSILDSHPDMAMSYEAHFIAHLADRRSRYRSDGIFDADLFAADVAADPNTRRMQITREWLDDTLARATVHDYPEAVRSVFQRWARQQGKSRYGDKTPGYVLRVDSLAELFPEAVFVHVVRDGRDVALSLREHWFADRDVFWTAQYWKRRVGVGRRAGQALGPERYHEVRYEDLVTRTEGTVRDLCRFVDLEFTEEMLAYHRRDELVVTTTAFPQLHRHIARPPTAGLRDWRRDMPDRDVRAFEAVAGDLLDELGYERRATSASLTQSARAAWSRVRWELERTRFHVPRLTRRLIRGRHRGRPSA